MRSRNAFAYGLAFLALVSGVSLARRKTGAAAPKRAAKAARADRARSPKDARSRRSRYAYFSRFDLDRLAKELDLTADQKKLIADAVEVQQEIALEQEKADQAKMKELYEQSKKIREEMAALSKQRYRHRDSYKAKIAELLTAGQKVRWVTWRLEDSVMRYYGSVKLTDEQSKKLDALIGEAAAKIAPLTLEQQEQAVPKAVEDIRKALDPLIPAEQKKQSRVETLAEQTVRMFRRAELTDQQVAKVKALAAEYVNEQAGAAARLAALRKEMNALHMKSRGGGGYSELSKKVRESVLTDAQRAKYPARGEGRPRPDPSRKTGRPRAKATPAKPRQ